MGHGDYRSLVAAGCRSHYPGMREQLLAAADEITVSLNGEPRSVPAMATVTELLALLGLEPRKVAVERNEAIVPRSTYATTRLAAGDALEIVHFIGGG